MYLSLMRIRCVKSISTPGLQCSVLSHCPIVRGSESVVPLRALANLQTFSREPVCIICSLFAVLSSSSVCWSGAGLRDLS